MAETKYGKYIVTELKRKFSSPYEGEYKPGEQTEILALDDGIIKGAFHVEFAWQKSIYDSSRKENRVFQYLRQ
jgi:hypothetical protein